MKPQLLNEVSQENLEQLLRSDDYAMSQKIDGIRLVLERSGLNVNGYGRSGNPAPVPAKIKSDFIKVRSNWTFDGELVGNIYYVFDVIEYPSGSISQMPWKNRNELCQKVLRDFSDHVKIVPQYFGKAKIEMFEKFQNMQSEGVVFCNINDRYRYGIRSSMSLKYKFTKTIDCIVVDKNINGKENLCLGLYDNGEIIDVGKVSAITGDGKTKTINIGDVVTVTYLYGTKSMRLYQPVKPIIRTDKDPQECLMNQMIIKNETILL